MYLLLVLLTCQATTVVQWQPDQKSLNQYLNYCKKDHTNQIKWAKDEIRRLKIEMRDIKRARIGLDPRGTLIDGETGAYLSFATESGKTDALVRAKQKIEIEEQRIKDLRDRSKPHYAYTEFKRPPNDYNNAATPFEVGKIFHHYAVHRVIKVLEPEACLVLMNWDVPHGGGEVQPHTTHVVVRQPTGGLVDGGPISIPEPLYVATTEKVGGRTYPVLVPLEITGEVSPSEQSGELE